MVNAIYLKIFYFSPVYLAYDDNQISFVEDLFWNSQLGVTVYLKQSRLLCYIKSRGTGSILRRQGQLPKRAHFQ